MRHWTLTAGLLATLVAPLAFSGEPTFPAFSIRVAFGSGHAADVNLGIGLRARRLATDLRIADWHRDHRGATTFSLAGVPLAQRVPVMAGGPDPGDDGNDGGSAGDWGITASMMVLATGAAIALIVGEVGDAAARGRPPPSGNGTECAGNVQVGDQQVGDDCS